MLGQVSTLQLKRGSNYRVRLYEGSTVFVFMNALDKSIAVLLAGRCHRQLSGMLYGTIRVRLGADGVVPLLAQKK